LQELGIDVVATAVGKSTEDDREKAREYLGPDGVLMTKPGQEQARIIDETGAHLFQGLLNLAADLKNALETPVFRNVARRAPWER
jgi:nitrogenase molybdenum-cofactor synthesis protein NifE